MINFSSRPEKTRAPAEYREGTCWRLPEHVIPSMVNPPMVISTLCMAGFQCCEVLAILGTHVHIDSLQSWVPS